MYSYKNYKKNYPNIILKEVREGLYPCFYCGVKSESIDHFIPIAFLENIRSFIDIADTDEDIREKVINNQVLIPACRECNSLASDGIFNTPNQKKAYIKAKFRKPLPIIKQLAIEDFLVTKGISIGSAEVDFMVIERVCGKIAKRFGYTSMHK